MLITPKSRHNIITKDSWQKFHIQWFSWLPTDRCNSLAWKWPCAQTLPMSVHMAAI